MKITNLLYGAAALSLTVAAAPAMAANPAVVSISSSSIDEGSGIYGHANIAKGMFSDILTFSVGQSGTLDLNLTFNSKGVSDLVAFLNGQKLSFTNVGTTYTGQVTQTVAAGSQQLAVTGTSLGKNANYSGNVLFSAVPEPTSWALMVLGFGAAGVTLRRRRSATSTGTAAFA